MLTSVPTRSPLRHRRLVAATLTAAAVAFGGVVTAAPAAAGTIGQSLGQRAVAEASRHAGQSYEWAAAGPTRFDCSGLTLYVFGRLGRSLPHSAAAQYDSPGVRHISRAKLAVGDLVFTVRSGGIGHVGIYAGNNEMWAATQTGDVVRKQSLARRTLLFGRVS